MPRNGIKMKDGDLMVEIELSKIVGADVVRTALDLMGMALSTHNHKWTTEEREAYETSIKILDVCKSLGSETKDD